MIDAIATRYHGNIRKSIENADISVIQNNSRNRGAILVQNVHIAKTIKELCKSNGITISTLLLECNLTKSFIYDLEKRSASPSCDKLSRIADYFNCSVDYLLGRTENPEINK